MPRCPGNGAVLDPAAVPLEEPSASRGGAEDAARGNHLVTQASGGAIF